MSVYVMSMVFKRYAGSGAEMLLALAIADHADDDGRHIFPTVESLADKTRQSVRTVQRQIRKMVDDGFLVLVGRHGSKQYASNEYRISEDWLNGKKTESLPAEIGPENDEIRGDKLTPLDDSGVTPEVFRGDNCVTTRTIINHHYGSSIEEPAPRSEDNVVHVDFQEVKYPGKEVVFDAEIGSLGIDPILLYEWQQDYQGVDVKAELRSAKQWLLSNPRKRKKDIKAFLVNWLNKARRDYSLATARGKALRGGR